jgi:diadenylate cyclase
MQGRGLGELARDLLDVLVTYYIIYRVCLVLRGTRAMQAGIGLGLVLALYAVAQVLRLATLLTILNAVLSSAILIVVVVFQNDIRRGLMRVGSRAWFGAKRTQEAHVIDEVVEAATELARNRTGAIIAIEQDANLDEFVGANKGHAVDASVEKELLVTLFVPEAMNKLHDGAVIIRNFRIAKAGVFFPMPDRHGLDQSFGSRHRAAIGITEETDAVVVVVSEERGSISFIFNGNIASNLDGPKLRAALHGIFAPTPSKKPKGPRSEGRPTRASIPPPPSDSTPTLVNIHDGPVSLGVPISVREPQLISATEEEQRPSVPPPPHLPSEHPAPLRKRRKSGTKKPEREVDAATPETMTTGRLPDVAQKKMKTSALVSQEVSHRAQGPGSEPDSEKEGGPS